MSVIHISTEFSPDYIIFVSCEGILHCKGSGLRVTVSFLIKNIAREPAGFSAMFLDLVPYFDQSFLHALHNGGQEFAHT